MTTYGEIVEPVSRTAWEDWDDALPQSSIQLKWQSDIPVPTVIDTLLIFEGNYLFECITQQTKCKFELVNTAKEASLHLFKVESVAKYMCVIKDYNLLQSSDIVELLKPYLSATQNIITVQTKPLAEFQSIELGNQNCIIRTVSTTLPSKLEINYPRLEQPNIISGVSAGVISLREHLSLPAKAIIVFMEYLEEYQVEELQTLLKKLNIVSNKSRPTNVLNANLYI